MKEKVTKAKIYAEKLDLLMQTKKYKKNICFTVEELRTGLLSDLNKYVKYPQFKQSVLVPAVEWINKSRDYKYKLDFESTIQVKATNNVLFKKRIKSAENPQTRTHIKKELKLISEILNDIEPTLTEISYYLDIAQQGVGKFDFLVECLSMSDNFVYMRESVYKENMEEKIEILQEAVHEKEFIDDEETSITQSIQKIVEDKDDLLNDILELIELLSFNTEEWYDEE